MGKKTSLHKLIAAIIALSYSLVLVMLICLEGYMNVNYRTTIRNAWQSSLYEYAGNLEQNMESVNANMYEIYAYDRNFDALRTAEGIDSLSDGYQLGNRLQTLEIYEKKNLSYVLYYDNMKQRKYYFNLDLYRNSDIEAIKSELDTIVQMDNNIKIWRFAEINGREYAISIYRSDYVALCEICNLANIKSQLEKELEKSGAEVFFAYEGKLLESGENAAEYEGLNLQEDTFYNNSYILKKQIGNTDLWMIVCIPANFWTIMNVQQLVLIFLILSSFLLVHMLYKWLKRGLLAPMQQMIEEMNKISSGDMESRIVSTSNFEEMQQTIDTINLMVEEIQKQKMISYEQTIEKQQAQMQYLTMQLKPHFYLNGLKTLNVLAINGETGKIQDIILKLSEHLRNLLQVDRELVPLDSEIAFAKNYVELQSATLERTIHVDWQVDVKKAGWQVPNLCVQTFVENSVKYAKLGSLTRELSILIQIHELETEDGSFLDIYIRDNGEGYPEEVLKIINGSYVENRRCIGINNFKRRCEILYGEKFEYAFGNEPGATTSYIIPWEHKEGMKQ